MKTIENKYGFSLKVLLLHGVAVLLAFLFVKDTLQVPLSLLGDDIPSYEIFGNNIDAEETSDDNESEEKEGKKGCEEFLISSKSIFLSLSENYKFYSPTYYLTFKSRVGERVTPPPQS